MKRAAIQETSAFYLLENITSKHSPMVILPIEVHSVLRRLEEFTAKGGFELHRKWRLTQEQTTHFEDPVYLLNRFMRIRNVFQHMVADYPVKAAAWTVGVLDIHPNNSISLRREIAQNVFRRPLMSNDELEHWLRRNVKYSSRFEQWEKLQLIQVYENVSYSIHRRTSRAKTVLQVTANTLNPLQEFTHGVLVFNGDPVINSISTNDAEPVHAQA